MGIDSCSIEWNLAFNPDNKVSTVEAGIFSQVDNLTKPIIHYHHKVQFSVAIEGSLVLQLEEKSFYVPTNVAIWIPPRVSHCVTLSKRSRSISLFFDIETVDKEVEFVVTSPLLLELLQFYATREKYGRSKEHLKKIADISIEEIRLAPRLNAAALFVPSDLRLRKILEKFPDLMCAAWTRKDWGSFVNLSDRSLIRLVQKEIGLTFHEWKSQYLLTRSISSLSEGNSVENAAIEAGYQDTSSFIRAFKKQFYVTPSKFKKLL